MIRLAVDWKRIQVQGDEDGKTWDISPPPEFLTSAGGPIVIIVHGYNNDQEEAEASYRLLRENLRELLGDNRARLNNIWELYWPGYLPKGSLLAWRKGPATLASALSYAYQERKTTGLGKALADYVRKIPGAQIDSAAEIVFIAHSLGCRVVMETLRNLVGSRVHVVGACLMAAAVPVFSVEHLGTLEEGAELPDKIYVLHSQADVVLHWTFRPGQFAAHFLEGFPEAVGRFGNPFHGRFSVLDNIVNTGLGHGDYYRGLPSGDPGPSRTRPTIGRLFGRPQTNLLTDYYTVAWPEPASAAPMVENRLIEHVIKGSS